LLLLSTLFCALFFASPAPAEEKGPVYVIPIRGEISKGLTWVVRRGIREAEKHRARAVILDMDTPGGRVDATQEIMDLLSRASIPTYTYVNPRAFSAGAYISAATRHIYMAPGGIIGAATPISINPLGGAAKMPRSVEEKMTSALRATIAAAAEENGHPARILEAMVDRDVEIPDVIEKGKLLTLTEKEAKSSSIALSEGTVKNLAGLLKAAGLEGAPLVRIRITPAETLSRFLTGSLITILLLMGGLAGIYFEFKTPGFGLPGIAGLSLLALFFFGHYVAGLAGYEEIILFLVGILLLFIELFITPGFAVMGSVGILLIIASFITAMGKGPVFNPATIISRNYFPALINFAAALFGLIVVVLLTYRFVFTPSSPLYGKFVLTAREKNDDGFSSSPEDLSSLRGETGEALTKLRPSGKARIAGRSLDVVSRGEYIEPGQEIVVVEVRGSRVVVKKV
jgi:membrane-bound serine protease (ClpP class)